jgi:hypothetical protein
LIQALVFTSTIRATPETTGENGMARLTEIVFDALSPARLARFWAAVLETYEIRAYDPAELARLASRGHTPETDPSVAIDGSGPTIFFQKSDTATKGRNRVHLDLSSANRREEVQRLVALGATVRDEHDSHVVMLDPEGNQFCLNASEA